MNDFHSHFSRAHQPSKRRQGRNDDDADKNPTSLALINFDCDGSGGLMKAKAIKFRSCSFVNIYLKPEAADCCFEI
jgi:hypothetical protein